MCVWTIRKIQRIHKFSLEEANRLYWLNNGPKAAPLYAKAEKLFADQGDARNELYAKIGRLRSEAETMSFVDLSRFLNNQLQNPIMRNDPRLRLWCLAAKGYTDIEIDYRAEKQDWLETQQIAKSLGDDRWATRASGELGVIAFLEGNSGAGCETVGRSPRLNDGQWRQGRSDPLPGVSRDRHGRGQPAHRSPHVL